MCMSDSRRGFWIIGFIDHLRIMTTSNYNSLTSYTFRNHCNYSAHKVLSFFTSRFLVMGFNTVRLCPYCLANIPSVQQLNSESESELLYDWRFTALQFILVPIPLRPTSSIFFQQNTCSYSPYVTFFLTGEWVCRFQLLLAFANTVILESKSRETHDHI
jgi:hypothetical protein